MIYMVICKYVYSFYISFKKHNKNNLRQHVESSLMFSNGSLFKLKKILYCIMLPAVFRKEDTGLLVCPKASNIRFSC